MLLNAPAQLPVADRIATQRLLNDLTISMSRSDAQLTDAVYSGNRVGAGWDTWFENTANQLLDARDAYAQLMPQDQEMSALLRSDAVDLAVSSGNLGSAYTNGRTFGAGWDTTLDRKIEHARQAAERLYSVAPPVPQPPVTPPTGPTGPSAVSQDAARAAELVQRSIETIRTVPVSDRGDASTKDARIAAYNLNMQAQQLVEGHFQGEDAGVTSQLRTADAHLEDANWQLAKKPSPDGRFNGVDIPGALRDSQAAAALLSQLAA